MEKAEDQWGFMAMLDQALGSKRGVSYDVPATHSAQTILHSHGWCDEPPLMAPTSVLEKELMAALEQLESGVPSGHSS
jgi:hypothetical protein